MFTKEFITSVKSYIENFGIDGPQAFRIALDNEGGIGDQKMVDVLTQMGAGEQSVMEYLSRATQYQCGHIDRDGTRKMVIWRAVSKELLSLCENWLEAYEGGYVALLDLEKRYSFVDGHKLIYRARDPYDADDKSYYFCFALDFNFETRTKMSYMTFTE
tara:strand:- start:32 stop:508 length:477 start_codon:yes stop_codon:yes gene_type:complete